MRPSWLNHCNHTRDNDGLADIWREATGDDESAVTSHYEISPQLTYHDDGTETLRPWKDLRGIEIETQDGSIYVSRHTLVVQYDVNAGKFDGWVGE